MPRCAAKASKCFSAPATPRARFIPLRAKARPLLAGTRKAPTSRPSKNHLNHIRNERGGTMSRHRKQAVMKARHLALFVLSAALIPLADAGAQAIAPLPAVPAQMSCTLAAFQGLNLNGVAGNGGEG